MSGNNLFNPWHIQNHGILKPEGSKPGDTKRVVEIQLLNEAPKLGPGVLGPCLHPSFRNVAPAYLEANGSKTTWTRTWLGNLWRATCPVVEESKCSFRGSEEPAVWAADCWGSMGQRRLKEKAGTFGIRFPGGFWADPKLHKLPVQMAVISQKSQLPTAKGSLQSGKSMFLQWFFCFWTGPWSPNS